jgi:hypothetical protein
VAQAEGIINACGLKEGRLRNESVPGHCSGATTKRDGGIVNE